MNAACGKTGVAAKVLVWALASCFGAVGFAADAKGSVEARLQSLEDRAAIEHLMVSQYPLALDRRLWKDYAKTFTEDGELVQGKTVTKGRAAIEELLSRPRPPRAPAAGEPATPPAPPLPPGEFGATKHIVTNLTITVAGDRATATAYWQTVATRSTGTVVAAAGHYVDALRKVNGEWKFTRREIVNPLRPDATGAAPP